MIITDARWGDEWLRVSGKSPCTMAGPANSHDNSVCNPKLAVEAIKSGAIDYLSKPYAPEELLHA